MPDFIETSVTINDVDLLNRYAAAVEAAPVLTQQIVDRTVNDRGPLLLDLLRTEPPQHTGRIRWTTPKQKRWFWAQVREGRIAVPYVRTHALVNGWHLTVIYDPSAPTEIRVTNDVPYRQFVTGPAQQGFHSDTGWYKESDVLDMVQEDLVGAVRGDLNRIDGAIDAYAEDKRS